jgi:RsiW-degrading membrane proteinase PrsW (M82 family)
MILEIKAIVAILPVFVFLASLVLLDSYKLVRFRTLINAIAFGCIAAAASIFVNAWLIGIMSLDASAFSRYVAPVSEELLKAVFLIYLIRSGKVGFMVDAAILGFAVGAGFALVENIHYLNNLEDASIILWIVRGFGTAALHGATIAIFGIISKAISDRSRSDSLIVFLPGFFWAVGIHSIYNHFVISPVWSTVLLMITLPMLIVFIFQRSEKYTRIWLGKGMDADMELLESIITDELSATPIGTYLRTIREKFPGKVVADMLCYLRIHCELAMGAKGVMLMRQAGINPPDNPEIKAKFEELKYLERSLGKTGRLAILPFIQTKRRDMWQLYMLGK